MAPPGELPAEGEMSDMAIGLHDDECDRMRADLATLRQQLEEARADWREAVGAVADVAAERDAANERLAALTADRDRLAHLAEDMVMNGCGCSDGLCDGCNALLSAARAALGGQR
jgi:uncharacterized coiled-coil DUF342 family protein